MRWDSYDECLKKQQASKESLVGIRRKKFAFFPRNTENGKTIWLEYYYAVYEKLYSRHIGEYFVEKYYAS